MNRSIVRNAGKLLPAVVMTAALAGCGHEHHRERVVGVVETPVVVDGIDVIDDPDPFVVERERFYVGRPTTPDRRNVVYYAACGSTPPRARAARLALQAREARRHRPAPRGSRSPRDGGGR